MFPNWPYLAHFDGSLKCVFFVSLLIVPQPALVKGTTWATWGGLFLATRHNIWIFSFWHREKRQELSDFQNTLSQNVTQVPHHTWSRRWSSDVMIISINHNCTCEVMWYNSTTQLNNFGNDSEFYFFSFFVFNFFRTTGCLPEQASEFKDFFRFFSQFLNVTEETFFPLLVLFIKFGEIKAKSVHFATPRELFSWPWLRVRPKYNTLCKIKNIRISFLKRLHSKEL